MVPYPFPSLSLLRIIGLLIGLKRGSNEFGQLGLGKKRQARLSPVKVTALENKFIKQIGCGAFHSVALDGLYS